MYIMFFTSGGSSFLKLVKSVNYSYFNCSNLILEVILRLLQLLALLWIYLNTYNSLIYSIKFTPSIRQIHKIALFAAILQWIHTPFCKEYNLLLHGGGNIQQLWTWVRYTFCKVDICTLLIFIFHAVLLVLIYFPPFLTRRTLQAYLL